MITVLATATQAAPYQQVANTSGVTAATGTSPNTATGKNPSQASGKKPSQQATGKNPSVQQKTDSSGSQTTVSINAGITGKGWILATIVLALAAIGLGIYLFVKRRK